MDAVQIEAASSERKVAPTGTLDRLLIAGSTLAILFLFSQILMFGYGRDQGIYAMVADAVVRGKMPYRDAWDFKPPGIFLVYALSRALFGPSQLGIRVLEVIGLAGMSAALVRLGERFLESRSAGFLAAALAILAHTQLEFWHTAQPESFGGMLTVFALLLTAYPEGERAPGPRALFLAGVLFGMAGLPKPPLAGGGAVLALWLGHREWQSRPDAARRERLRALVKPALLIAAGGVTPMVLTALWFLKKGALSDLHQVLFVFTPHYTKLGWEGSTLGGMFYWGFSEWLIAYCSSVAIGLLLALGFGAGAKEKRWLALFLGVVAIHGAGVVMQAKFFPYHWGATWPVTAVVAAFGFQKLRRRLEGWGKLGAALFGAAVILSCFGRSATKDTEESFFKRCLRRVEIARGGFKDRTMLDRLSTVADVNAADNRAVADYLREKVPADRPVFVWGFEPAIYDMADRRPASRFLYNVPQRVHWSKAPMRETLLRDLAANPPAAVVVEHNDLIPMVTGDAVDSAGAILDFWDFYVLLQKYRKDRTIADMDVYLEKEPSAGE
jgi:Dolichyl-phosphate-mannose-protein mannosyltransferase